MPDCTFATKSVAMAASCPKGQWSDLPPRASLSAERHAVDHLLGALRPPGSVRGNPHQSTRLLKW